MTNSKGKPVNTPYGLMIASDGFNMKKGLADLWDIIVEQNVATVISFANAFKTGPGGPVSAISSVSNILLVVIECIKT